MGLVAGFLYGAGPHPQFDAYHAAAVLASGLAGCVRPRERPGEDARTKALGHSGPVRETRRHAPLIVTGRLHKTLSIARRPG
jgi:hypothetical protein